MANEKVRLGFVGAGWWATSNHMPVMAKRVDVEMSAVCRLGATELAKVKEAFNFDFATEDAEQLVNHPNLDAVVVSSPHTLHFEHARMALERGLHVLCEKPMCTRGEQARELVQLATANNVHLLVPYGWHYKPYIQKAKQWLDDGLIGDVQFVLCHLASPIRDLLQGQKFQAEESSGQAGGLMFEPDPKTWADPKIAGGGFGHSQLSHSTGMLFWLTDLLPQSVYALMSGPDTKVDLYDSLSVRFYNGAIGTISGAGTIPPTGNALFQVDIRLFGSEGLLMIDCERPRLQLRRHDGKHQDIALAADAGTYDCSGPPNNFIDLVLGKTATNYAPGEAAMRSVVLLDAAYRSAASGQVEMVK